MWHGLAFRKIHLCIFEKWVELLARWHIDYLQSQSLNLQNSWQGYIRLDVNVIVGWNFGLSSFPFPERSALAGHSVFVSGRKLHIKVHQCGFFFASISESAWLLQLQMLVSPNLKASASESQIAETHATILVTFLQTTDSYWVWKLMDREFWGESVCRDRYIFKLTDYSDSTFYIKARKNWKNTINAFEKKLSSSCTSLRQPASHLAFEFSEGLIVTAKNIC